MTTQYFPAIIERAKKGFGVFFPDLPGCTSFGKTMEEAARNAEEALRGHLLLMIEDGDAIPKQRPLDKIERDPDVKEAGRILVRADLPGKAVRLNISLDEGLVEAIDVTAHKRGMTRSGFLAEAAKRAIQQNT
ncbi:MAG: type II toxin-antitoxin system HicB family antitoxin [Alphaproteobacteria bacterium]|nr:type II toxin-antitoxin system HicB family antitoxin [Alphaproteobacteria bacterium]